MAETPRNSIRPTHARRAGAAAPTPAALEMSPHPAPHAHVNLDRCRLSLIKGEQRWRFRWEPGAEATVISAVADLARNPLMHFDWFDAAVVCRHLAQGLPDSSSHAAVIDHQRATSARPHDSCDQK